MRTLRLIVVPALLAVTAALAPAAVAAPTVLPTQTAAAAISGSFSVLTYNIAGLPLGLSDSNPAVNTPEIGKRLAPYDVVNVQEDFNYHAALYANDTHPYRTPTSGGALIGDGLNTLSDFAFSDDLVRVTWANCNGTDCLTPKGFTFLRTRIAEGVYVDVYNLHPNAGSADADYAARRANITQLSQYITANSAGNAVVVMGDTNTRYTRAVDNIRTLIRDNGLTDPWVQLVRGGVEPAQGAEGLVCDPAAVTNSCEVVDKILYRGNAALKLTATRYNNDNAAFLDASGTWLSDHYPLTADISWTVTERFRLGDQFGGPHGTSYHDAGRIPAGAGVRSIGLRGNDRLDQVSIALTDGTALTHGGTGGNATSLTLAAGEHLTSVTMTRGKKDGQTRVFSAQFGTDRGRTVSAGKATADTVTYTAPAGWQIAGFHGRSGTEIDKLGLIYVPITA